MNATEIIARLIDSKAINCEEAMCLLQSTKPMEEVFSPFNQVKEFGTHGNPFSQQTYLRANFVIPPTFIDYDRSKRGDYYKKPTAYYYINCEPTNGMSFQKDKVLKRIVDQRHERGGGLCSEERSMISPDYARNFICDFIIGKKQNITQLTIF